MNASRKGSVFERKVVADLEGKGWLVTRASNSKGVADVWAVRFGSIVLVEAKSDGRCDPDQWNHLYQNASEVGAIPLLAEPVDRRREKDAGPVRYWRLTGLKDGSGKRQPREPW